MAKYTSEDRRGRRTLDYRVLTAIDARCDCVTVEAYASAADVRARRNKINDMKDAHRAAHYRAIYLIPTLVGPGKFVAETHIHIDADSANYPFEAPASWVLTAMPFSPHFKAGSVVCIGEIWERSGHSLLGHIVRHHARLLNWHEVARGGGYRGWNGAAIDYHRQHYGSKPLNDKIVYPEIPEDVAYGVESTPAEISDCLLFPEVNGRRGPTAARRPPASPDGLIIAGVRKRRTR